MSIPLILGALLDLSTFAVARAQSTEPCILRATHGTPLLLGDVPQQTISLTATGGCASLPVGALLLVNSTDNTRRAAAQLGAAAGTIRDLTVVAPVPAPRDGDASVAGVWSLFADAQAMSGEKPLAQVMLTPLAVAVTTTTTTTYLRPALTEAVAIHAKPPGVAYVLPTTVNNGLMNVASLALPALPGVTTWKASTTDATLIVDGKDCKADCVIASPASLAFKVDRPSPLPLLVRLEATRPHNEKFTLSARLAESAAYSSIPLNIADTAYLLCQKHVNRGTQDEIRVNNLAAITNSAVTNNLCKLVISEEDIDRAIALQNNIPSSGTPARPARRSRSPPNRPRPRRKRKRRARTPARPGAANEPGPGARNDGRTRARPDARPGARRGQWGKPKRSSRCSARRAAGRSAGPRVRRSRCSSPAFRRRSTL